MQKKTTNQQYKSRLFTKKNRKNCGNELISTHGVPVSICIFITLHIRYRIC